MRALDGDEQTPKASTEPPAESDSTPAERPSVVPVAPPMWRRALRAVPNAIQRIDSNPTLFGKAVGITLLVGFLLLAPAFLGNMPQQPQQPDILQMETVMPRQSGDKALYCAATTYGNGSRALRRVNREDGTQWCSNSSDALMAEIAEANAPRIARYQRALARYQAQLAKESRWQTYVMFWPRLLGISSSQQAA